MRNLSYIYSDRIHNLRKEETERGVSVVSVAGKEWTETNSAERVKPN